MSGRAADDRRVAGDVEVAHQPADRAERLREVGEVLHEEDERREEGVERDAGEQQHVGGEARAGAPSRARRRWRRRRASRRSWRAAPPATPAAASCEGKVMASIAPSAAPAETPSVNGVASGLRSSAWNTTPAAASALPTSAPASARGSRATKKICASTLSRERDRPVEQRGRGGRRWSRRAARAGTPRPRAGRRRDVRDQPPPRPPAPRTSSAAGGHRTDGLCHAREASSVVLPGVAGATRVFCRGIRLQPDLAVLPDRHHRQVPAPLVVPHLRLDAVESLAPPRAVSTSDVGPLAMHAALAEQHQIAGRGWPRSSGRASRRPS